MTIQQVAKEIGLPLAVVRKAAKGVYGTRPPKEYSPHKVRFLRWVLACEGKLQE